MDHVTNAGGRDNIEEVRKIFGEYLEYTERLFDETEKFYYSTGIKGTAVQHTEYFRLMKRIQRLWFRLRQGPVRVIVLGCSSAGKSTLINALAGEASVPEADYRSSKVSTWVSFSENTAKVGKAIYRILKYREREGKPRRYTLPNQENNIVNKGTALSNCHAPNAGNQKAGKQAAICVEAPSGKNRFLKESGVTLIDTPGIGQSAADTMCAEKMVRLGAEIAIITARDIQAINNKSMEFFKKSLDDMGINSHENVFIAVNNDTKNLQIPETLRQNGICGNDYAFNALKERQRQFPYLYNDWLPEGVTQAVLVTAVNNQDTEEKEHEKYNNALKKYEAFKALRQAAADCREAVKERRHDKNFRVFEDMRQAVIKRAKEIYSEPEKLYEKVEDELVGCMEQLRDIMLRHAEEEADNLSDTDFRDCISEKTLEMKDKLAAIRADYDGISAKRPELTIFIFNKFQSGEWKNTGENPTPYAALLPENFKYDIGYIITGVKDLNDIMEYYAALPSVYTVNEAMNQMRKRLREQLSAYRSKLITEQVAVGQVFWSEKNLDELLKIIECDYNFRNIYRKVGELTGVNMDSSGKHINIMLEENIVKKCRVDTEKAKDLIERFRSDALGVLGDEKLNVCFSELDPSLENALNEMWQLYENEKSYAPPKSLAGKAAAFFTHDLPVAEIKVRTLDTVKSVLNGALMKEMKNMYESFMSKAVSELHKFYAEAIQSMENSRKTANDFLDGGDRLVNKKIQDERMEAFRKAQAEIKDKAREKFDAIVTECSLTRAENLKQKLQCKENCYE